MSATRNQFNEAGGRRKFGVSSKITNEIRRALCKNANWVHNTPCELLRLFEYDTNRRYLPIRGNRVVKFHYSNLDVLSLMRTFAIEIKTAQNGKKLFQSPLFSCNDLLSLASNELGYEKDFPYSRATIVGPSFGKSYQVLENKFESDQVYIPTNEFSFTTINTIICAFHELYDLYLKHGTSSLEERFFKKMTSIAYKRLDSYGLYVAILHIKTRGLASLSWMKPMTTWIKSWSTYSTTAKNYLLADLSEGNNSDIHSLIDMNIAQEQWKYSMLSHEAKLIRYSNKLGTNLYDPTYMLFQTFKRGIYDQMTDVERYRFCSGINLADYRASPRVFHGEYTMFKVKESIAEAVDEALPKVKETISDAVKEMLVSDSIKESVKSLVTDSMEPTLKEFENSSKSIGASVIENLKSSMQPIIDQTFSLFSSINGLISFFQSMVNQAIAAFPSDIFGTNCALKIDAESLLSLIKYYIVYIHVDSRPLKIALIYLMMKEIGLLEYITRWGGEIFKMVFNQKKEDISVPEGSLSGEFTSDVDWLSSLIDMILKNKSETSLCIFLTTLLYMIFRHTMSAKSAGTMRFNEYTTLAGTVMGICKGFHWVGSGMFGIDRIYKYFMIISQSLTKFVREKFLGIDDDVMKNEKAVSKWLITLKFFSTDTGRNAIRVSKPLLERAERVMADGLAFIASASKDPKFISRDTLMLIHRSWADVKTLSNYVYRLRSTSQFKPAMFHIQFVGEPGIGKSTLTEKFIESLSEKIHPKDKVISHWTYNPNVEHFDGYNGQTYMIIDDLFRYNEPKHLSLIIGLITNTPVPLPMAHLEDKGVHLDSDILLSSTNVPYPIGKDIFCMEAVHRRRHVLCEVKIDPRVKQDGKFSKELFNRYYPNQKSYDFPHLQFSLMKPVINPGESPYQSVDNASEQYKYEFIKKLQKANQSLSFEPDFYFGEDARPPAGMTIPCTGWSFKTFVENAAVAYTSLRDGERKLTKKDKYEHVMECFAELDNIFAQHDDVGDVTGDRSMGVYASDTFRLISDTMLDATLQYGSDDPLGERIYMDDNLETLAPDMVDLDIDAIINEFVENKAGETTVGSDYQSAESSRTEEWVKDLPRSKMSILTTFIRSNDIRDPTRGYVLSMLHKCAMEQNFNSDELKVWDYVIGLKPDPFQKDQLVDMPNYQTEECTRRERIMRRVKKKIIDPNYANMCSIKYIPKSTEMHGLGYSYVIPIRSHYTQWDATLDSNTFPGENFQNYLKSDRVMEHSMKAYNENDIANYFGGHKEFSRYMDFFRKLSSDNKFYFPRRSPYTKEQQQQGDSRISIEFLRRLEYHEGEWCMNIDDLPFGISHTLACRMFINGEFKQYCVPLDFAFFCSINQSFTYTANLFTQLSVVQQEEMIKEAKWMYQHMYSVSAVNIRERLMSIAHTVKRKVMAHVFDTLSWVWKNIVMVTTVIAKLAIFGSTIYLFTQLGKLLMGSQEPTSKFLHRSQVQTGMRYRGTTQSGFFDKNKTQEVLAQQYLDKNIKFFQFVDIDGKHHIAHGIHTKQFLIINAHVADVFSAGVTSVFYQPTVNSDKEWEIEVWPHQIAFSPGNDLAIIFSRHLPMAKDILHHFITDADFKAVENCGELWSLTNFYNQQSIEIRDKCAPHEKVTLTTDDGQTSHISAAIAVEGTTVGGKSGSMLMRPSTKPGHKSIVGIQAWKVRDYYKNTIFYQVVTQEMLKHLTTQVEIQVGRPVITQTGPIVCEPTSAKIEGIVSSHVNIEGSVPEDKVVGMIGRTQFRKTAIATFMDGSAFTSPRVPAALNPWDHRLLVKDHPMKHSVNKHGTGKVGSFDLTILDRASQDMAYWLRERLDVHTFNTNLNLEQIITGIREPGSNPVDCRKSAGLPYVLDKYPGKPKGKKAYVDIDEEGQCVINSQEFVASFESTYRSLRNGVIPSHSSYDFPKDELRPFYKALGDPVKGTPPRTRSVTCMNMEMIFSWRRVTLELMASLHRAARGNFPFGPGINPEGPDWTRLFHYLNKHPNCMDFDVSNWDGHLPPELMYAVGDMLCIILRISYSSPEAKVIYSLLTEVLFGHVQFQDLVYQKCRGLISGFPGTAEVNTLVHLLLMYYFYLYTASLTDNTQYANIHDFFFYVSPVFYGDDVIMSVSDEIIDWFHGQTIAEMYTLHGYPVTSASKDSEMPKRKDLLNCSFLKSGFKILSPARVDRVMDLSVCYDLMYWVRAKEHPYDQFRSNLFDSFRLVHGHGRTVYNTVLTQVNGWLRQASLPPFDYQWENYENDKITKYYSS
nr:hypothetical protein [Nelson Picorna-like virus 8]